MNVQDLEKAPSYGGEVMDISTFPAGTTFYVENGWWKGKIVLRNGRKCVQAFEIVKNALVAEEELFPAGDERNKLHVSSVCRPGEKQ